MSHRKRGTIKSTLFMSYSKLVNSPVDGSLRAETCSGKTSFTAKPRKRR